MMSECNVNVRGVVVEKSSVYRSSKPIIIRATFPFFTTFFSGLLSTRTNAEIQEYYIN